MRYLHFFRKYLVKQRGNLVALQILMLIRPVVGSFGFLMIVPLLMATGFADSPEAGTSLDGLLSFLPNTDNLALVLGLFFTVILLSASLNFFLTTIAQSVSASIRLELQSDIHSGMLHSEWLHVSSVNPSEYMRLLTEEVDTVSNAIDLGLTLVSQLLMIVVYIILCLYLSPPFTLMAIALGLLLVVISIPINRLIGRAGHQHLSISATLYRQVQDQFQSFRIIRSSGSEEKSSDAFEQTAIAFRENENKTSHLSALSQFIHSSLAALAFCVLAWNGLTSGSVDLVTLALLALIFSRLLPQVSTTHGLLLKLSYLRSGIELVANFMDELAANRETAAERVSFTPIDGLKLEKLTFTYPGENQPAFSDVEVDIPFGNLVVVTGKSGAGKTTLLNILAGLMSPSSGSLSVGDKVVLPASRLFWREQIAYVPQNPHLIEGSIRDNLILHLPDPIDDNEIIEALGNVAADFAISAGLDSPIGNDGTGLSGGEIQRLLLARAILQNRPVLILDEITSQIDLESENRIAAFLEKQKPDRLIIIATHRPDLIAAADQIISLEPGSVHERKIIRQSA